MKKIIIIIMLLFLASCKEKDVLYSSVNYNKELVDYQKDLSYENHSTSPISDPFIKVNPYEISPLSAIVSFTLDYESSVTLIVHGKTEDLNIVKRFPKSRSHLLPVLGLYNGMNKVSLITDQEEVTIEIQTVVNQRELLKTKTTFYDKNTLTNELIFLSPAINSYPVAYDINGDLRYILLTNASWEFEKTKDNMFIISTSKLVNPPYYTSGYYKIDLLGKIYYEYNYDGGYHHDYVELPNGNMIIASNDFNNQTVEDYLIETDQNGEIVREIKLYDILSETEAKAVSWTNFDWFHNNSVDYDSYNNLIILSGRHQDSVVALDYDTLKIKYILGDPSDYSEEFQQYLLKPTSDITWFYHQHAAKPISKDEIILFDNGNYKGKRNGEFIDKNLNYSRGIKYKIDLENMTVSEEFSYGESRGASYYSPYISDIDFLTNDSYLVHSGGVVELNGEPTNAPAGLDNYDKLKSFTSLIIDNELAFELETDLNYYRAEIIDLEEDLYHDFSKEFEYKSFYTPTKTISKEIDYQNLAENFKLRKFNLNTYLERDRFVVSGSFSSGDIVNVILKNNQEELVYDFRISEKPYTALCVSIFEDRQLAKYINLVGLSGNYNVYIEINEELFNLEKTIYLEENK